MLKRGVYKWAVDETTGWRWGRIDLSLATEAWSNNKLAHNMSHRLTSSSKQHWERSCTFITLSWQLNRPLCVKGNGDRGGGLFTYLCILVLVMTGMETCKTDKTYVLCFKNLHLNSIWIKGKSYCFVRWCLDKEGTQIVAGGNLGRMCYVPCVWTTLQGSFMRDRWHTEQQYCKNTHNCNINWST